MLENFEEIDTKLADYGIMLVSCEDKDLARKEYGVKFFPSLGLFRNGNFVRYTGDLKDELEVLEWLIARETLEIPGKIESVNSAMLYALLEEESDLVVFFYREDNRLDEAVLYTMADLDKATAINIDIVHRRCGSTALPRTTRPALFVRNRNIIDIQIFEWPHRCWTRKM